MLIQTRPRPEEVRTAGARVNRFGLVAGQRVDGERTEVAMTRSNLSPDLPQRWRLRNPRSGREVVVAASPGVRYFEWHGGTEIEVTGRLLPLAPSPSRLPWAEGHLRFCPWCDLLVQKDLNYCPYDGRPLPPIDRRSADDSGAELGSS
jgi:hypothetical protein